jgi:hypothetical protein
VKRVPSRRGFLLITILLVSLLLFTMGVAFLGSRSDLYQSSYRATLASQARSLARSGLEDARAKLDHDLMFPPANGLGQTSFTYSEDVTDAVTGTYLGCYRVSVSSSSMAAPYFVLQIVSTGFAGPRSAPVARHTYTNYIDMSSPASPTYFQSLRFEDDGTL